jgi:hypothetical protein
MWCEYFFTVSGLWWVSAHATVHRPVLSYLCSVHAWVFRILDKSHGICCHLPFLEEEQDECGQGRVGVPACKRAQKFRVPELLHVALWCVSFTSLHIAWLFSVSWFVLLDFISICIQTIFWSLVFDAQCITPPQTRRGIVPGQSRMRVVLRRPCPACRRCCARSSFRLWLVLVEYFICTIQTLVLLWWWWAIVVSVCHVVVVATVSCRSVVILLIACCQLRGGGRIFVK